MDCPLFVALALVQHVLLTVRSTPPLAGTKTAQDFRQMATFERVLFHQSTSGFPDGFRAFGGRFWWPQKAATKILGLGFVVLLLGSMVLG